MMEFAIDPTRLSRSRRITSVMKCEFTLRSRSETERRKFMCTRLGASSRMCWKVSVVYRPEEGRLRRGRHRGTRLAVEQRHFAEEIARLNERERFLFAAAALF